MSEEDRGDVIPYGERGLALDYTEGGTEEAKENISTKSVGGGNKMLRCSTCGQYKDETDFHLSRDNPRGRVYSCKACSRIKGMEYWKKKKASIKAKRRYMRKKQGATRILPNGLRLCSSCKRGMPLTAFGFARNRPDGLQYRCKKCRNMEAKIYKLRIGQTKKPRGRPRMVVMPTRIPEEVFPIAIKPIVASKGILQEMRELKERVSRLERLLG